MAHLTHRKIVKIGKNSLAITLPKAWIRFNDLRAGDILEVISGETITIKPLIGGIKKSGA